MSPAKTKAYGGIREEVATAKMHRASPGHVRLWRPSWAPAALGLLLSGCSLLSIKTPEVPLTASEQQARLLTRDYAAHFSGTMTHLIDDAVARNSDPSSRSQAVRLKIGVVSASTRAATGLSPIGSLLDTWAFAIQLRDYLVSGAGAELLGGSQSDLQQGAVQLADEADQMAKKASGADYERYKTFVMRYAFRYPLESADCERPSVLSAWAVDENGKAPLRAEGTVAQALGDFSDRMRIYSEELPSMGLWQAERSLDRAGVDSTSYRTAFRSIDAQLAKISTLAETSPALVHEAIADLRSSLNASSDRLDNAWMEMLRTLHAEREALAANIASERENAAVTVDVERARISADAAQIAARAVDTSWSELRKLVREALLLLILLSLVLLGLPFVAGYMVGRLRRDQPDRRA